MNVGDRIKFSFGGEEKEGMILKVFPKKAYLKVDFPNHPGKIVIRSLAELEGKSTPAKRNKRREKAEKEKKLKKEKKEQNQARTEQKGAEGGG